VQLFALHVVSCAAIYLKMQKQPASLFLRPRVTNRKRISKGDRPRSSEKKKKRRPFIRPCKNKPDPESKLTP
jgi:hypothetical protein